MGGGYYRNQSDPELTTKPRFKLFILLPHPPRCGGISIRLANDSGGSKP